MEGAKDEEDGKKRGPREKEGPSINCPALCGKLRFNSHIQRGREGAWLPAGGARIHAVHDPHAFYMVTTWQRIASRCVKERSRSRDAGKRPLIISGRSYPRDFRRGDSQNQERRNSKTEAASKKASFYFCKGGLTRT